MPHYVDRKGLPRLDGIPRSLFQLVYRRSRSLSWNVGRKRGKFESGNRTSEGCPGALSALLSFVLNRPGHKNQLSNLSLICLQHLEYALHSQHLEIILKKNSYIAYRIDQPWNPIRVINPPPQLFVATLGKNA